MLLVLAVVAAAAPGRADDPPPALVAVVGASSPVDNLTRNELRRAFLGEPVSEAGVALVPFNLPPQAPEREAFERRALGMSPDEVGRYWVDRRIRGQGQPPRTLPSPTHVQKVVPKFPGAISYLTSDRLTADLKAVKVDGKTWQDPAYPLR